MKVDKAESLRLAKEVSAKKKQCYLNSFRAMTYLPGCEYVEGWAMSKKIPIPLEHGWLIMPDGETIIDVTWTDLEEVVYFPIVQFTLADLLDEVEENGMMLPTGSWQKDKGARERMNEIFAEANKIIKKWNEEK